MAAALVAPAPAEAAIPDSLKRACERRDAADGDVGNGVRLPFWYCDDGVPDQGGTTPNPGGVKAVTVPQRYGGDGFSGLPPKAPAEPNTGADGNGDIALDVVVLLPDPARFPPPRDGYPLAVMSHGCCSGTGRDRVHAMAEQGTSHPNATSFAARGYVVLSYSMRGFVDGARRGSTGVTEIDSRRYEINDLQHLAGQLADTQFTVAGRPVRVDPDRVVVNGGSYSGGLSWMTFTDPTWTSPGGRAMRVVAVSPRFGWTDLAYSLIPNGTHPRDALTEPTLERASTPLGLFKRSIVSGLFVAGTTGTPSTSNPTQPPPHATFAPWVGDAFGCAVAPGPTSSNPACASSVRDTLPSIVHDRSAYYQNHFFERIRTDRSARPAVFSAAPFTDPLFTAVEHRRMVERLKSVVPGYPVQEYYGDYEHFVQNKPKEWNDVCGNDRLCRFEDYPGGDMTERPRGLERIGVNTRLDAFLDHYAKPPGNPDEPRPSFDVTAGLQICPANAGGPFPADQPGERFTESSFDALAPDRLQLTASGTQTTTNDAEPNHHAARADPVFNEFGGNQKRCPVENTPAGPGVAVYDLPVLQDDAVMIGRTRVNVAHTGTGSDIQLDARLYELFPDGTQVMVDRGHRVLTSPNGPTTFDLNGNGWRFTRGNRLRIELAQDDEPYLKSSAVPSSLTLTGVSLDVPVRNLAPDALIAAPEVASDVHRNRSFPFVLEPRSGELTGVHHGEVETRPARGGRASIRRVSKSALIQMGGRTVAQMGRAKRSAIRGRLGRTYRVRSRLFDRRAVAGDWSNAALVVIPYDDRQRRVIRYGRGWRRVKSSQAYGKAFTRARRRRAALRFRFRGDLLYIVGRRSRRGGKARVILNGRRRTISFRARRTRNRVVVARLRARRRGVNRLRLVALRGRVEIDAIGARRP